MTLGVPAFITVPVIIEVSAREPQQRLSSAML